MNLGIFLLYFHSQNEMTQSVVLAISHKWDIILLCRYKALYRKIKCNVVILMEVPPD